MSGKRRINNEVDGGDRNNLDDQLTIVPLGAGQEVGRSCHLLKYKGFTIMLDCGIHPGLEGMMKLPYFNLTDLSEIDFVLVTHFHLDHCGALPYLLERTTFRGDVYMTKATRDVFKWNLQDQVRVSGLTSSANALYTEEDVNNAMKKITTVSFKQSTTRDGVTFTPYCAGHVLGACMYEIEIAGVRILYTGDYSREQDRHLMTAEIPPHSPDVLLIESTFGTHIHSNREEREHRLLSKIHSTVLDKGGKVLLPAFALGRVQELLLILDEYWHKNSQIRNVPLYYASSLAKKCMKAYMSYVPSFKLRHVKSFRNYDDFQSKHENPLDPCVVLASPGMLQSGISRELFENWAGNSSNCVILAGYSVEGTLAHSLKNAPKEVESLKGEKLSIECDVQIITFAAHVDCDQNLKFIGAVDPSHVILVHGEKIGMRELRKRIEKKYDGVKNVSVHDPKNTVPVTFQYRGEKMAKIMGRLVQESSARGKVCGVLVSKNFNNMILSPEEMKAYTNLMTAVVNQKQLIPFHYTLDLLANLITTTHGMSVIREIKGRAKTSTSTSSTTTTTTTTNKEQQIKSEEESVDDAKTEWNKGSERKEEQVDNNHEGEELVAIEVMGCVRCSVDTEKAHLVMEWSSSPEADMWADAVLAVAMQTSCHPIAIKMAAAQLKPSKEETQRGLIARRLFKLLSKQFGKHAVARDENTVTVKNGDKAGKIHLSTMKVSCDDIPLHRRLLTILNRLRATTDV
eukprot:m.51504 g.51504  ORF g.51504 m.51504 type:complete len:740 (-) comp10946_c0_seq2:25-2244(-)